MPPLKIQGRSHDLGGGMFVNRVLPFAKKRMVGPYIFLDHMGPLEIPPGQNTDVRPHPHIGLSTMTYLFEGRIVHRDSLGSIQTIQPGEVNWMTAGRGISHSERAHDEDRTQPRRLHGLQFWVALRDSDEDAEPSFVHYESQDIPSRSNGGIKTTVIAGRGFGLVSPLKTSSPMIFTEFICARRGQIEMDFPDFELGVYVVRGQVSVAGVSVSPHEILVFEKGELFTVDAQSETHFVLIGGEPFQNEKHIWWNLVSSSREQIEATKTLWREGRFPMVPGETEFIPLPE